MPVRGRQHRPLYLHGKEGVDGSSPSEGSAKAPQTETFLPSPRSAGTPPSLIAAPAFSRYASITGWAYRRSPSGQGLIERMHAPTRMCPSTTSSPRRRFTPRSPPPSPRVSSRIKQSAGRRGTLTAGSLPAAHGRACASSERSGPLSRLSLPAASAPDGAPRVLTRGSAFPTSSGHNGRGERGFTPRASAR